MHGWEMGRSGSGVGDRGVSVRLAARKIPGKVIVMGVCFGREWEKL